MDKCNIEVFVGPRFGVLYRFVQVCGPYLPSNVGWRFPYTLLWQKYLKTIFRVYFLSVMVRYLGLTDTG